MPLCSWPHSLREPALGGDTRLNGHHVVAERVHRCVVRLFPRANAYVERRKRPEHGQELDPDQLSQSSLELIAIDRRMPVQRNDDSYAGKTKRGSQNADIEVLGPNSLPLSSDGLNVLATRQPIATRKSTPVVTLRRTCSGALR